MDQNFLSITLHFFFLVRLLFPPAPTSLTLDPRVFSFSIIVAAVKRDQTRCCVTFSLPQLSRVNYGKILHVGADNYLKEYFYSLLVQ